MRIQSRACKYDNGADNRAELSIMLVIFGIVTVLLLQTKLQRVELLRSPRAGSEQTELILDGFLLRALQHIKKGCVQWQGLRGCIPPNFPYFAVEMGLSSGHVHVIDDEEAFPDGFGRGVLVGLLQLPPEDMHRSAKQESVSVQVCTLGTVVSSPTLCGCGYPFPYTN